MTCEAMWIVASFHSTSLPFIQILPVPGNPIRPAPHVILMHLTWLLSLSAEWASIRAGVERLAAMPAEARLGGFARLEASLDVMGGARGGLGWRRRTGPAA